MEISVLRVGCHFAQTFYEISRHFQNFLGHFLQPARVRMTMLMY
jgi:hypothetical protein